MSSPQTQQTLFKIPSLPWTPDQALLVIKEFERSNHSIAKFAKIHGVAAHRIRYWRDKAAVKESISKKESGLLRVHVQSPREDISNKQAGFIEVIMPGGFIVKFHEEIAPQRFAAFLAACTERTC